MLKEPFVTQLEIDIQVMILASLRLIYIELSWFMKRSGLRKSRLR